MTNSGIIPGRPYQLVLAYEWKTTDEVHEAAGEHCIIPFVGEYHYVTLATFYPTEEIPKWEIDNLFQDEHIGDAIEVDLVGDSQFSFSLFENTPLVEVRHVVPDWAVSMATKAWVMFVRTHNAQACMQKVEQRDGDAYAASIVGITNGLWEEGEHEWYLEQGSFQPWRLIIGTPRTTIDDITQQLAGDAGEEGGHVETGCGAFVGLEALYYRDLYMPEIPDF